MPRRKRGTEDVSRETIVEPLENDAKPSKKGVGIREVVGIGAVPAEAKSFAISRVVKDGRENTGFEPMFIPTDDGVENRYFPISCLSTLWIREKFGPGRYRVTMRDESGRPRFGHRTVGVMSSKEEAKAAPTEKRPSPRTPAELELELARLRLETEQASLKERREMQDRFFSEMKDLLLSARPQAAAPPAVDVKAEVERAIADERRYNELQTKLAVIEATGFEDDDDDKPARAPKLTDMEKTLGTVKGILELAQPLLANPLISNALQLLAAPYLERLALQAQEKIAVAHDEHSKRGKKPTQAKPAEETPPSEETPVVDGVIEPPAPKPSATRKRASARTNGAAVRRKVPLRIVPDPPPTPPTPGTERA